ncbi:MAG: aldehyde ferredoxin oxidoreductase C-terminal domain-containing protein, partial [Opitutae bacterium]
CEGDWTLEKLSEVGERIWNLEKLFNLAAGLTKEDDKLPERLTSEPAESGPAKGLVSGVPEMLPEYYQVRGWDAEGNPNADTRKRLGL